MDTTHLPGASGAALGRNQHLSPSCFLFSVLCGQVTMTAFSQHLTSSRDSMGQYWAYEALTPAQFTTQKVFLKLLAEVSYFSVVRAAHDLIVSS